MRTRTAVAAQLGREVHRQALANELRRVRSSCTTKGDGQLALFDDRQEHDIARSAALTLDAPACELVTSPRDRRSQLTGETGDD